MKIYYENGKSLGNILILCEEISAAPAAAKIFPIVFRDDIKSSEKISILNQFKIGGGEGVRPAVKFKIANSCEILLQILQTY